MKFSSLGFKFLITRKSDARREFTLSDVRSMNDRVLYELRNETKAAVEDRLSEITIYNVCDTASIRNSLEKYGVAVVPDFIPRQVLEGIEVLSSGLEQQVKGFVRQSKRIVDKPDVLFQKGAVKVKGYKKLSNYKKAVVQVREGQDQGMIDVFNVDKWIPEFALSLRPYFELLSDEGVVDSNGARLKPENLNLYFNESVSSTRGFHVDSYKSEVKAFIYLTDVLDLGDGPYAYVKSSHVEGLCRRMNRALSLNLSNSTEFPLVPYDDIVPILAKKGALVISDQSGAHRGIPQSIGCKRVVAVMKYR